MFYILRLSSVNLLNNKYTLLSSQSTNYLVLMTRPLTVLSQTLQGLVDKRYVLFIYVQSEKTKASSRAPADTVQKLQCLTHQIVVGLIILATEEILQWDMQEQRQNEERKKGHPFCYLDCL